MIYMVLIFVSPQRRRERKEEIQSFFLIINKRVYSKKLIQEYHCEGRSPEAIFTIVFLDPTTDCFVALLLAMTRYSV